MHSKTPLQMSWQLRGGSSVDITSLLKSVLVDVPIASWPSVEPVVTSSAFTVVLSKIAVDSELAVRLSVVRSVNGTESG